MLQLNNQSRFKASMALFANEDGVDTIYAVLKATFVIAPTLTLATEQLPIRPLDEHWGDPAKSSLKYAAELGLAKPGTDIVLIGHAYSANARDGKNEVSLRVGPATKSLRIFGNRVWDRGLAGGFTMSDPEPFEKMPLRYEFAFGGTDEQPSDPKVVEYEARNPIGRGFVAKKSKTPLAGMALPNIEDAAHLISDPKDRPAPAGFGPVCAHWEPRKSFAGTYDEKWQKGRAPYLPVDFNKKFHQAAHRDLALAQYLSGGEEVEITGATPSGDLRFQLPRCTVQIVFDFDGKSAAKVPHLDTVCFEPDERRFTLLWRASQVVDKKVHRLKEAAFTCAEFPLKTQ